ncbi:MAG TPA: LptE family protein [Cyclobacteriaceae bacterium]|jgi:hypothetical protein
MKLRSRFFLIFPFILTGCGIYSFTGTTLPSSIRTFSVQEFFNDTDGGPPNLGLTLTNEMRDYFQSNSSLTLVQEEGDLQFEGGIIEYRLTPVAPTNTGTGINNITSSSVTRLTIVVRAAFTNTVDETQSFNRSFNFYADFNSVTETLNDAENRLIETIFEQIILDIFNASVAVW